MLIVNGNEIPKLKKKQNILGCEYEVFKTIFIKV